MKERGRQAHSQVGGGHLVLSHASGHVAQQAEERAQGLAVLVGQQQHGGAHSLQAELFGYVWRGGNKRWREEEVLVGCSKLLFKNKK